jgi:exopolyphosphatase / guanosine-5'-triphosphate,3'-diphosphate pyrophosphatase
MALFGGGAERKMAPVRQLAQMYDREPEHARQVTRLALMLYDGLTSLHGGGQRHRLYLRAAALLHDIGWHRGGKGHHKSSLKLILEHDLSHWQERERRLVANIARYHRGALPAEKHSHYRRLHEEDREWVGRLAALLRLADGLDRSHSAAVEAVRPVINDGGVVLELLSAVDLSGEYRGVEKKKDLFEHVYGRAVTLRQPGIPAFSGRDA